MNHATTDPRSLNVHPLLAIAAALAVAAGHASIDASIVEEADREFGPAISVGNGTVRSYVEKDGDGMPVAVGVAISEAATDGLASGHDHTNVLELPAVEGIPFRHITFGWNPAGHPPERVYDRPHFDVHFFTISDEQRRAIVPERPDFAELGNRLPAEPFRPVGYMADPHGPIPGMGLHWIDPQTPELNGVVFTETLLFGSWDGELIFIEPMITRDWLLSKPRLAEPLAMPARVPVAGLWPTLWSATFDEERREYRIELGGLGWRGAGK